MSFIQLIDIKKSFGSKQILKKINLSIEKGEIFTILGGSGSGKTVLLKILLRLIDPDSGKVLFDGEDIVSMDREQLRNFRRRVGLLFQGGALFDSLSVRENIAYPLREYFKMSEEEISKIVAEKLELVGLPGIEEIGPNDLSGGMKKRVSLARSIATSPEVILYDEPTTGLDPINTTRINHLMLHLKEKLKVTSIVVTHDMGSAFAISDRIALIREGEVLFVGTTGEAKNSKDPYVKSFITGELLEETAKEKI